jgi:AcrR family transcriptional regulator
MPQVLKEHIQRRIREAALSEIARQGFAATTMSGIAAAAGISTGNVYRYHASKDGLLDDVLPDSFVRTFLDLLHARIDSLAGVADIADLEPSAPFFRASAELMDYCVRNRLEVVVLLGHAEGTPREGFVHDLIQDLADKAEAHFRTLRDPILRFTLVSIYRNWVRSLVEVLALDSDPGRIRAATEEFSRYHLAGLGSLFAGRSPDRRRSR